MATKSAIVIGAGIVGLAAARALSQKGYSVRIFERNQQAVGASIRNFGMVWPIGQPSGFLYESALRSRAAWQEISRSGAFWHEEAGSLHLAYHPDEWQVLQELYEVYHKERPVRLLSREEVIGQSNAVVEEGLIGGLFSSDEVIVNPKKAIAAIPAYLEEKFGTQLLFNKCVSRIESNTVYCGQEKYEADRIILCSGADFETLYPELFSSLAITKCKLQMMRLKEQGTWRMGPSLCGGLSLAHYKSFEAAPSLALLKQRFQQEMKAYLDWGIHVMVSQNEAGELTIGDSHEYGLTHDPFDRSFINDMIVDYLKKFARFQNWNTLETWNGVYAKLTNGEPYTFLNPDPGVWILNGLGGAGMTLSFGLAEKLVGEG